MTARLPTPRTVAGPVVAEASRVERVHSARLVHRLLEGGSAYGTAFPSSHIAAAWSAVR